MKRPLLISMTLLISLTAACDKKSSKRGADVVPTTPTSEEKPTDEQKPMDEQKPVHEHKPVDEQMPAEKPVGEQMPAEKPIGAPKPGDDLIGEWSTECFNIGTSYTTISYTFRPNKVWTYSLRYFTDILCTIESNNATFGGPYTVGNKLANGSTELDLGYVDQYLVYKVENGSLIMSLSCDAEDIADANDSYCRGRPAPIGESAVSRSLDLDPRIIYTKL